MPDREFVVSTSKGDLLHISQAECQRFGPGIFFAWDEVETELQWLLMIHGAVPRWVLTEQRVEAIEPEHENWEEWNHLGVFRPVSAGEALVWFHRAGLTHQIPDPLLAAKAANCLKSHLPAVPTTDDPIVIEEGWFDVRGKSLARLPRQGWAFRPGEAAYNANQFPVRGQPAKLLKRFVLARGARLSMRELLAAVAPSVLERETVRGYLSELRAALREGLAMKPGTDPIPVEGKGDDAIWLLDLA